MPPRSRSQKKYLEIEALLRSINIRMDATEADRIAHFRPTYKCVSLIQALLGRDASKALLVTAPYGTGKSLTAAYCLHLIENRPDSQEMLKIVESRLREVDAKFADFAARRRRAHRQGLAILLDGEVQNLPEALHRATIESMERVKLGRQARVVRKYHCKNIRDALEMLDVAQEKAYEANFDRITILWDEFGRYLEDLISNGRAGDLADLQTLAEYISRSSTMPATLGLLLHQSLMQYADRANQSVRTEWAKIEGRFDTHAYVDDSRELYRLVAECMAARRPASTELPTSHTFSRVAKEAIELGYFSEWKQRELTSLLAQAYPLGPSTLFFLPIISGRVGQNERTLFTFLSEVNIDEFIGLDRLYDYFSPSMRVDTGVGGTYRRWLETESALSKTEDPEEEKLLKSTCLLGLGISGERAKASYSAVCFAIESYNEKNNISDKLDSLIQKKLILYRRHSDQVAVWHGTDLDLRSRLEDAKARERNNLDIIDFLTKESPPPIWKPVAHNDCFHIKRFLSGIYCSSVELHLYIDTEQKNDPIPAGIDGQILYLLPNQDEPLEEITETIKTKLKHPRLIVSLPREHVRLTEAALEVWCLRTLQHEPELVHEDPLAAKELEQLADDAHAHLQHLLDKSIKPGPNGPRWFYRGEEFQANSVLELRKKLSEIMDGVYPNTPCLRNEMINRHKPSRVLVNARKKALLGILERNGQPDLGIEGQTPDASIYRTLLARTGLYRPSKAGIWGYAKPEEIQDIALRAVWKEIERFFAEPAKQPKNPEVLFHRLMSPPYGLRQGVLPVLFAAGYQAFASMISIARDSEYLDDILPSHIEDIVKQASLYRVRVLSLSKEARNYLEKIYMLFSGEQQVPATESDLVRGCYDAIMSWRNDLPSAALSMMMGNPVAKFLQSLLSEEISGDPAHWMLEQLPKMAGQDKPNRITIKEIEKAKIALESVTDQYVRQAAQTIKKILALNTGNGASPCKVAASWANCFPDTFLGFIPEQRLQGLITRLRTAHKNEEELVHAIALLLVGRPVKRWDNSHLTIFERELDAAIRRIEEIALLSPIREEELQGDVSGLAELAKERMTQWHARYKELAGEDAANAFLRKLELGATNISDNTIEESTNGLTAGSA